MLVVLDDLSFRAGAGTDLSVERPVVAAESVSLLIVLIDLLFLASVDTDLSVE